MTLAYLIIEKKKERADLMRFDKKCFTCGAKGHIANECFEVLSRGTSGLGDSANESCSRSMSQDSGAPVMHMSPANLNANRCVTCKRLGHGAMDCPQQSSNQDVYCEELRKQYIFSLGYDDLDVLRQEAATEKESLSMVLQYREEESDSN